jgi:hypothetical protein
MYVFEMSDYMFNNANYPAMRSLISSLIVLIVFSVVGLADLQGAPQNPHNPHDPTNLHNLARQSHEQAMHQHQQAMQQAMDQHMRDHNNAIEMHNKVHEDAKKFACCIANDPNCPHQWHEVRPIRREGNLVERIRTWRENRREARESQD